MKHSLLCTVLAAALGAIVSLAACKTEIQHGLDEAQANRIVSELRRAGIDAHKVSEKGRKPTFAVEVPKDAAARSFEVLLARNLPRKKHKGISDVFGKPGLVPTSTEEHMRMVSALSGELAETLSRMDGVLDARVLLVIPEKKPFEEPNAPKEKPRASVFLKVAPGAEAPSVEQVRALVAGAVPNLSIQAVTVVSQTGPKLPKVDAIPDSGGSLFKYIALASTAGLVVLGLLVVWLTLRLKKLKSRAARRGSGRSDRTGTSLTASGAADWTDGSQPMGGAGGTGFGGTAGTSGTNGMYGGTR